MDKLVLRWGLGAILALAALPFTARAQTPPAEPAPAEPAPAAPAAAEPPPVAMDAPMAAPPAEASPSAPPVAVVVAEEAPAAEEAAAPAPTFSGYVEASYHNNFSDPDVSRPVPLRVYDPAGHGFTLHAAHLALSHKFTDAIGATIEFDVGRDAVANAADTSLLSAGYPWTNDGGMASGKQFWFDVQEAYANYSDGGFTLTAGKFVTYEGIEVIEGPLNPTITRGFLYGWAEPFTHTGIKLHYQPVDAFNIGIGVVNGWDLISDNNEMKTFLARIAITPSKAFFAALSGSVGPEQTGNNKNMRISVDLTGAITPSDAFALWFQGNFGSEKIMGETSSWYGFGLQPVVTAGLFSFGGRLEYFADPDGVRTLVPDGKFFNITLTPGVKLGDSPFKIRGELRADISSEKLFGKDGDKKTQFTGALSAEYTF